MNSEETNLEKVIECGALIVDVRTSEEFNQGHIKGSLNIPLDEIGQAMEWLQKDVPTIVCCASGSRSGAAKQIMEANGFTKVYNGGAWDNLGKMTTHAGACPVK